MLVQYTNSVYLSGIHHCPHADSESTFRHLANVPSKETSIGLNGVDSQGLDSGTGSKGGAWLIEGYVAIWTNTWKREGVCTCVYM